MCPYNVELDPNSMRKFFLKVNENQVYRDEFLNDPKLVLDRDLGIAITTFQANQINQIRGIILNRARNIPRDPPGLALIQDLRGEAAAHMPDDSVIL